MRKIIFFIIRAKNKILLLGVLAAILGYTGHFLYVKSYLIDRERLGNVISHLYVASVSTSSKVKLKEYYSSILAHFNITPTQLIKNINYYSKDLHKIYKYALDEILIQKAKIEA